MTTITRSRTPAQDARWEHLVALLKVQSPQDRADERTEADDDAWRYACMLRNQAADDAALYNTQDRPDAWGVGY